MNLLEIKNTLQDHYIKLKDAREIAGDEMVKASKNYETLKEQCRNAFTDFRETAEAIGYKFNTEQPEPAEIADARTRYRSIQAVRDTACEEMNSTTLLLNQLNKSFNDVIKMYYVATLLNTDKIKQLNKPVHYKAFSDLIQETAEAIGLYHAYVDYVCSTWTVLKVKASYLSDTLEISLDSVKTDSGIILQTSETFERLKIEYGDHMSSYLSPDQIKELFNKLKEIKSAYDNEVKTFNDKTAGLLQEVSSLRVFKNYILTGGLYER